MRSPVLASCAPACWFPPSPRLPAPASSVARSLRQRRASSPISSTDSSPAGSGPKKNGGMNTLLGATIAHVSGSSASCPGDIFSDEASDDDVELVPKPVEKDEDTGNKGKMKRKEKDDKDEKIPFYRLYKSTCLQIGTAAERISTSVEGSSAPPTNSVPTIAETMKMVKECGVKEGTALMYTTTSLIVKPDFRKVFNCLETIAGRLDLLKREHEGRQ
ncbi:hypothetical protein QOZ80_1BG0049940 [Eleusine coracana subsp. coracana]|nr:hypothetical protein QOZ80_1BG0049940 [Eleusine coracana subsp. coracana]